MKKYRTETYCDKCGKLICVESYYQPEAREGQELCDSCLKNR